MTVIPVVIGVLGIITKGLVQGSVELEKKRMSGDYADCSIIKTGQNPEKSPGDLKRLPITWTPVGNHRLTLMGKTLKPVK